VVVIRFVLGAFRGTNNKNGDAGGMKDFIGYAPESKAAQAGAAPILIRIETRAGHGAGKPTDKVIEERADMYGFLVRELKMKLPAGYGK